MKELIYYILGLISGIAVSLILLLSEFMEFNLRSLKKLWKVLNE